MNWFNAKYIKIKILNIAYKIIDIWHHHCIKFEILGFPRQRICTINKIISKVCKEIWRKWRAGSHQEGGDGLFIMQQPKTMG